MTTTPTSDASSRDGLDESQRLSDVTLDHVAVAIDDMAAAGRWWHDLGATPVARMAGAAFSTAQVRLSNGGKVELIGRGTADGEAFIDAFLQRYGSGRVHHITLKVQGLLQAAIDRLRAAGLDVIDVNTDNEHWHESFLRPSQVGGVIVQVAWASSTDEEYAVRFGDGPPPPPDPSAPAFERVVLGHDDLDRATQIWRTLGADVTAAEDGSRLVAAFPAAPILVEVRQAERSGPLGIVLRGHPAADRTDVHPQILGADS